MANNKCTVCDGTGYGANELEVCYVCFGTGMWHDSFDCPDCDHGDSAHITVVASEYGPCFECEEEEDYYWDEDEARETYLAEQADLLNDEIKIRQMFGDY